MDLTRFTKKQEKKGIVKEIIVDNEEIKIVKIGEEVEYFIKKESALKKYEDFLFMSPTNFLITDNIDKADEYFKYAVDLGVEGVMIKNLKASYSSGLRVGAMAKLKETKEDLDVVILGAEYGTGKRGGFYSSFVVAVKGDGESEEENFLTVGKVSSGIKEIGDEGHTMENLTNLLKPLKLYEKDNVVYFEPKIILQVRYQEIQKSTTYNSGYALRFPRIILLRSDKTIDEINSIEDVEKFA